MDTSSGLTTDRCSENLCGEDAPSWQVRNMQMWAPPLSETSYLFSSVWWQSFWSLSSNTTEQSQQASSTWGYSMHMHPPPSQTVITTSLKCNKICISWHQEKQNCQSRWLQDVGCVIHFDRHARYGASQGGPLCNTTKTYVRQVWLTSHESKTTQKTQLT